MKNARSEFLSFVCMVGTLMLAMIGAEILLCRPAHPQNVVNKNGQQLQVPGLPVYHMRIAGGVPGANVCLDSLGFVIAPGTCAGGGAALPAASAPGQIVASTASGTTYAPVANVFYNQPSDTLGSIEAECTSPCAYVVTQPQTLTLVANHTLSSNVQLWFDAGGLWTVNGSYALTIGSGIVGGSINRHFAGTASILGLSGQVPVEWFGVVGYPTCSAAQAGADYTTAIQKTINSITAGIGQAYFQGLCYLFSNGISITSNNQGMAGASESTTWISTSASINQISLLGTNSARLTGNRFARFHLQRLVQPTGTTPTQGVGIYMKYVNTPDVRDAEISDSLDGFYLSVVPSATRQGFNDINVNNGVYAVNSYTSGEVLNSFDIDTEAGIPNDSLTIQNSAGGGFGTALSLAALSCFNVHGAAINDLFLTNDFCSGTSYGVKVVYDGSGATDTCADIHIDRPIFDAMSVNAVLITGLIPACAGSVTLDGGYLETDSNNAAIVSVQNSSGVLIIGNNFYNIPGGTGDVGVYSLNNTALTVSGNKFQMLAQGYAMNISGTTGSVFSGNTCTGLLAEAMGDCIIAYSTTTGNFFLGNVASGYITTAYNFDSTSLANSFLSTCTGGNIGTCQVGSLTGTPGATWTTH